MRWILVMAVLLPPSEAAAQDESIDIGDVGSSRIGGPGLSSSERKMVKGWDEPDEYLTEETLPKPGSKKRLPGLHTLAKRYYESQMWKDACQKFDTIQDEYPEDGVAQHPMGVKYAGKSYIECAKIAFGIQEFELAEKRLVNSEKFIKSDYRHEAVRRKILRERYRRKASDGDIGGAIKIFNEYQSMKKDEDERIWFGEQLATRAVAAHEQKDEITRDEMMGYLQTIAPMNTDYRRLKEDIETSGTIVQEVVMYCLGAVFLVFGLSWFTKWRAKARIGSGGTAKNPFIDDEI